MGEGVLTGGHAYHRPQWQATNGPARHAGKHNSGNFHGANEAAAYCRQLEDERSAG